ncbi:glycosyltransferase [Limosilactobacillus reuteri]|uniref:glycosyltransferase n=1 Tax=Limosilactobacillus reuteri TaxID=1598 RepID=UPI00143DAD99|nr:glycosyltransferase [Limosilactobacillus reuteri]QIZ04503.1 glycosyltransferase family 4 protein [Limosilactobacillus reuteri]
MRFIVNDVAATPEAGGIYSILEDMYKEVLLKDKTNEWFFILSGKYFKESNNVKIIVRNDLKKSKIKKFLFETITGRKYINKFAPDVYISLQNISTLGVNAYKKIVYLHQPVPFQKEKKFSFFNKKERKLFFYQSIVGKFIKYSIKKEKPIVIVQTEWMKKATKKETSIPTKNIYVAHPKIENIKYTPKKRKLNTFIYPASNYLYKNHEIIFSAIEILKKNGINNFSVNLTLNKDQLPYDDNNINYIGHIKRKKVFDLYKDNCLLFPSYIESFGLPLIEAALEGDIIIAAKTEFSRELLKGYSNSYFFKYNNPHELASLMKRVIEGKIIVNGKRLESKNNGESLLTSIKKVIE